MCSSRWDPYEPKLRAARAAVWAAEERVVRAELRTAELREAIEELRRAELRLAQVEFFSNDNGMLDRAEAELVLELVGGILRGRVRDTTVVRALDALDREFGGAQT